MYFGFCEKDPQNVNTVTKADLIKLDIILRYVFSSNSYRY